MHLNSRFVVLAGCAVAALLTTEGCFGSRTTTATSTTAPTTTATDDPSAVIDYRTVDPATLGVPIYPGAKPGGGVSASGHDGSGTIVGLTTPDGFEAVYDWYKHQLPADAEKMKTSIAGFSTATFRIGADKPDEAKVVTITSGPKETTILVNVGKSNVTTTSSTTTATSAPPAGAPTPSSAAAGSNDQVASGQHDDVTVLGLPVYPNAQEAILLPKMLSDAGGTQQGRLLTADSFDTVYAWYKKHMPSDSEAPEAAASDHTADDGTRMALFEIKSNGEADQKTVALTLDKGDVHLIVTLLHHTTTK